jgi:hypothetical protein
MKKLMKKIGLIVSVIFFLIFVELAILYLKEQVSLFKILEIASIALVALLYYFIVSSELKMALKLIEEGLMRVEKRFEKVEMSLDEDVKILKKEINGLKKLLGKSAKK